MLRELLIDALEERLELKLNHFEIEELVDVILRELNDVLFD